MKNLMRSVKSFRRFNRKDPRKLTRITLDDKTPLIRIGNVPEITYISNKEGATRAYRHKTTSPMPVLYAHPNGKFFVMIGGRVKVKDWLHG